MGLSASWRAAFAAGAVNLVLGANLPYLPVWMERVAGMSGAEIAGASTIAILIRIVAGPLAAGFAQDHGLRGTLASVMVIALAAYALLFPDSPRALDFFLCVLVYSAMNVAGPLFEAVLVYGTRNGRPDYGESRAIASAAFVSANLAGGAILSAWGPHWVLIYLIAAAAIAAIAPLFTKQGARAAVTRRPLISTFTDSFTIYRMPGVFVFLLAAAFIQASHGAYYAFASNIWIAQGIGGGHIGALWATGVAAEIVLLLVSRNLLKQTNYYALLWLGGLGALVRWTAAGFVLPVEAVYVFQTLHAASFAMTHIGTMRFLQAALPDDKLSLAYSANGALIFGPAMAVTGFVAGLAYDALAPGGIDAQTKLYWLMVIVTLAGLALAWRATRQPITPDEP
ncbi:MFS transporter [Hyphomonas sp. WL0036]|uniref:MFS transporter n=1 Tax=Hyphomonas sediminis TaxID=2866160 RepID=UPI001C809818|nr:MFS transporter [Hyphomonas sediminis]MBY9066519.1 MFS transporter [Hyphomonas sediminis]